MLISIQSWYVIYQITAKEHCYSMQFSPDADVSIGTMIFQEFFSNVN